MSTAPLIAFEDEATHTCEIGTCPRRSRWYIEACSTKPEPYLPPVLYVCERHIRAAFTELLATRKARRARA